MVYLALAGIDLVLFFAAAMFLGYLLRKPYLALLAAIGLAQAHLLVELFLGGILRFSVSHPSAFDFMVTWSPFFVPTIGTVVGALVSKLIWSKESATTIA